MTEFQDIFMRPDGKLGRTSKVKHNIDTAGAKPIKQAARRLPRAKQEVADAEVEKMLQNDIIVLGEQ